MQAAVYDRYYEIQPQFHERDEVPAWITRARTFVVVVNRIDGRGELIRDNANESMLILPAGITATIKTAREVLEAADDSLTILPAGRHTISCAGSGSIVRIFTTAERDLCERAPNRDVYRDEPDASLPVAVRDTLLHYRLADHIDGNTSLPMRVFRSQYLMANLFVPQDQPRDLSRLTPHSHADFEQGSLALAGTYTHHLRYPWIPDHAQWLEDEHVTMDSPSLVVIPRSVIHTTTNDSGTQDRLIDIFSPPRQDFLDRGIVCNANDYRS
ncbi:hypothetical protein [Paraburkholderia sp. J41]|uniref:hypothetical protein n=1 Tax=Paraburkholderia sp. J41 TaxID=2805433 RepID=UPI002AC31B6C|nr:hypothetical protein [Paraburkholderia sp. J41]